MSCGIFVILQVFIVSSIYRLRFVSGMLAELSHIHNKCIYYLTFFQDLALREKRRRSLERKKSQEKALAEFERQRKNELNEHRIDSELHQQRASAKKNNQQIFNNMVLDRLARDSAFVENCNNSCRTSCFILMHLYHIYSTHNSRDSLVLNRRFIV